MGAACSTTRTSIRFRPAILHDGRQHGQLDRQPRRQRRIRAAGQFRRQGRDHLLLDRRARGRLAIVELAMGRSLGSNLLAGSLTLAKAAADIAKLQAAIGHVFKDQKLLAHALTHVSSVKSGNIRLQSYQRLEFLGDRVLGLAVAEMLSEAFPRPMRASWRAGWRTCAQGDLRRGRDHVGYRPQYPARRRRGAERRPQAADDPRGCLRGDHRSRLPRRRLCRRPGRDRQGMGRAAP